VLIVPLHPKKTVIANYGNQINNKTTYNRKEYEPIKELTRFMGPWILDEGYLLTLNMK
jgi:hypothetical protein